MRTQLPRLRVALMGDEVQNISIPPALTQSVGSITGDIGYDGASRLAALAGLLAACSNVDYLGIAADSIEGLADMLPRPLSRLRHVHLEVDDYLEGPELARLLQQMPNVRYAPVLPTTSTPLDGPDDINLQNLTVVDVKCASLEMLVARRWTASSVLLQIMGDLTRYHLECIDWAAAGSLPNITELRIHTYFMDSPEGGISATLPLIMACRALRRLELKATGAGISSVLPHALLHCPGLHKLDLILIYPVGGDHQAAIVDLLRNSMPRALRKLRIASLQSELLGPLRPFCRERRVACDIGDLFATETR